MTQRLRVLTWNIRSAAGGDDAGPNVDRVRNLDRIAGVIEATGADIVGLQEVDRFWRRSGGVNQARVIADRLAMEPAFAPNWLPEGGVPTDRVPQYGVAILSRFPFQTLRHVRHGTPAGWEPRGSLVATVRLPTGERFDVANTHLQVDPPSSAGAARDQRRAGVERTLAAVTAPAILMGDFNAQPGSEELGPFAPNWSDAWLAREDADAGYTFPARTTSPPRERIDYLYATAGVRVADIQVVIDDSTRLASDHYPVRVDLEID